MSITGAFVAQDSDGNGDVQVAVSAAVTLATAAAAIGGIPTGAKACYINPINGDLAMTRDGQTPSATRGGRIASGMWFPLEGPTAISEAMIAAVSGTVTVNLQFLG